MNRKEIAALRLWHIMPLDTMTHFAKQQSKTTDQVCMDVVTYAPEWAFRITEGFVDWCINDLRHDFVGLVNKDEIFIPRL